MMELFMLDFQNATRHGLFNLSTLMDGEHLLSIMLIVFLKTGILINHEAEPLHSQSSESH